MDTDGTNLFFDCNFNSIVETTLSGTLENTFALPGTYGEGENLTLVANYSPPPPNTPVIPEPSSLLLLGTGVLGMAGAMRRKLMA